MSVSGPVQVPTLPLKSVAGALLFTVFLGPVGLLYASALGGTVMIFVAFVVICSLLPIPIILMWVSCSVWGVLATNRYNKKVLRSRAC